MTSPQMSGAHTENNTLSMCYQKKNRLSPHSILFHVNAILEGNKQSPHYQKNKLSPNFILVYSLFFFFSNIYIHIYIYVKSKKKNYLILLEVSNVYPSLPFFSS